MFKIGGSIGKAWEDGKKALSGMADKAGVGAGPEKFKPGQFEFDEEAKKRASDRDQIRQGQLDQEFQNVKNRDFSKMDLDKQAAMRSNQQALIEQLQAASRGEGPSAAQAQLKSATDQNLRNALAMAASSRGNPALAAQAAGRERAIISQTAANQSAALRAQEMQAARGLLGDTLQSARGQDIGLAQSELQAVLAQQQQKDAMQQFYESQLSQNAGNQTATDLAYEQMRAGIFQNAENLRAGQAQAAQAARSQREAGILGGAGTLGAAAIAASDERVKKNVSKLDSDAISEFFNALEAKNYEYKNPGKPGQTGGEKVGLMAQDVEDTELGQKLFSEGEDGTKQYDPQVLDGIMMAAIQKLMKKKEG